MSAKIIDFQAEKFKRHPLKVWKALYGFSPGQHVMPDINALRYFDNAFPAPNPNPKALEIVNAALLRVGTLYDKEPPDAA